MVQRVFESEMQISWRLTSILVFSTTIVQSAEVSAPTSDRLKPRIYIYQDAVFSWKTLTQRCLQDPWKESYVAQYGSGLAILDGLLAHPQRTLEPGEADLFFVPISVTVSKLCPDDGHIESSY